MKMLEAWELYQQDKTLLNYSKHTLRAYKTQCSVIARYMSNPDMEDVRPEQLKQYLIDSGSNLKAASLGHKIRFVRSFFRWAFEEGHIVKNPALRLKEPKMPPRVPKFLTEEDVENLREACVSPMEHAIVEFLYTTGCRIGEVALVNKKDIDWEKGCLIVLGKGRKEREVYFNTKCKIWLKNYLKIRRDDDPALFVTERSPRRMSIAQMRYVVKRIAKRGGISANVYPHRLRHSFATHLLDKGAPMEAIQQFMGHHKISTTQVYAELSGERRREIYKKYFS